MHIDLEMPALPTAFQSDICIVGGGVAGILLASRLGNSGGTVHLLEAGGLAIEERSQKLYRTGMAGHPHAGAAEGRFRTFGGSSTRWGGQILPFTEDVLHPPASLDLPQWPISLVQLEPYSRDVQHAMGVSIAPFSDNILDEFGAERPFQSPSVRLRFSKCAPFARRNLAKTLGRQCLASRAVTVFTHANAISIDLHSDGNSVRSVTAVNYGGVRYTFQSKQFVLCTGTIEVSRLLLASTSICSAGIGNSRDQVGRYFHDHIGVRASQVGPRDRECMLRAFAPYIRNGALHKARLEATPELRCREALLSVSAQFPIEEPADSGTDLFRSLLRSVQHGDFSRIFQRELRALSAASADIARVVLAAKLRRRRHASKLADIIVHIDVEQRASPQSRIRLAAETDALGMRKAILDWKISDDEHRTVRSYAHILDRLFREHRLATLDWKPEIDAEGDGWLNHSVDTFHMMGGARMGIDPANSVVNSSLQVHGIENLYIASCAVFPTGGSSNPTFTMMALTLRLADRLQACD